MRNLNDKRIKVFLKDPNKKSFLKILKEVFHLFILKREIPFYYFKYIYRKDVKNYKEFLSTKEVNAIGSSKALHNPNYKAVFDNKLFFSFFVKETSIRSPKLIAFNLENNFFINNKKETINSKEELLLFFKKLFEALNLKAIFFRPPSDYGGKGCFKLSLDTLEAQVNIKYESLINGCYVLTEVINQHNDINRIHSNSVNTIRVLSLITAKNTIEIISAFMRFGVGESVLDNSTSGGFYIGINLEDGTLKTSGLYLLEYGGGIIHEHPDSHIKLEGFKVPFFKEVCDEVRKAVKLIPDRFVGWDVAVAQDGPIIIEANSDPHIFGSDYTHGGLLKNEHINELIDELKVYK